MKIGIGLPATLPGVTGSGLLDWARRAEERDFSSLAVLDRLVYPNYEPVVTLAAAAAVTERIRLATTILVGPYRNNAALLAKQAATIDHLSGGRLVLGLAAGGREDDYRVSGVDYATRGARFDADLDVLERAWAGQPVADAGPVGPRPPRGRPTVILGGTAPAAFRRAARHGDGWIFGGGNPTMFADGRADLEAAWRAAGRQDTPHTMSLAYFALGDTARGQADAYLLDYYRWLGDIAGSIAAGAATTPETVRGYVAAFAAAGCDELVLVPCDPDPGQVDRLADLLTDTGAAAGG
jgi:alkanesulfonate monooxygenase SsuD/methylene tetrahydromethanopterin reductase-like flavin-dependent oxidoreductase (luciferase family)